MARDRAAEGVVGDPARAPGRPARVLVWLFLALVLAALLQRERELVRWRLFAAAVLAAAGFALWHARAVVWPVRRAAGVAMGFALTLLLALLPALVAGDVSTWVLVSTSVPVVAAWSFFLLVQAGSRPDGGATVALRESHARHARRDLALLLAGTVALMAGAHLLMRAGFVAFFDEALYVLQSTLMGEPGFARRVDESFAPFFVLRQTVYTDGRLFAQYPPGQPLLLALFDAAGLRWWSGVILSTVGVLFTYKLGGDLYSRFAGLAAGALLAATPLFVVYGPSYMGHGAMIAASTAAAWLLHRTAGGSVRARRAGATAAGLLLGCALAVRPLTGAVIGTSIAIWSWLGVRDWRARFGSVLFMAMGAAAPIAGLLYYNAATTGSPFVFGYTAVHGSLHDLGFGPRGYVIPDAAGQWTTEQWLFDLRGAFQNLFDVLGDLWRLGLPAFVLVPLLWITRRYDASIRWRAVVPFLLLPAVHFFYFYPHSRFQLELFPFFFVGLAGLLATIGRRDRALARGLVVSILALQLFATGLEVERYARARREGIAHAVVGAVRDEANRRGPLLVFVEHDEGLLNWLSWLTFGDVPGRIIVARDLGAENARLMQQHPDHRPIRVARRGDTFELGPVE